MGELLESHAHDPASPSQRQQPARRPKLGPWQGMIEAVLEDAKQRPARIAMPLTA
ncbi:MAG TPA: hypothetical protein VGL00_21780 [Terracidiphilus sp.]